MSYIKNILKLIIHKKNQIIYYIKKYGLLKTIKKCIEALKKRFLKFLSLFNKDREKIIYSKWIKKNEPTKNELKKQRNYRFKINPKISIIVPMYKTDKELLKEMVESVKNQTYSNWELCIADGSPKINKWLQNITKTDKKIKYKFLNENKGISGNSNEALKMATGQYIALLDHDDTLAPFALYEIIKLINKKPQTEFIYSDEDKLSFIKGERETPIFKQDFSIDHLRTCNYICHFSVLKKELMDELNGFRYEYDGSQDHDLVLRVTEKTNKIEHIPKILYHWRYVTTSFSNNANTHIKAWDAGEKAVQDHLDRLKIQATAEKGDVIGLQKINYKILGNPSVTILIPNRDQVDFLKNCIESILKNTLYKNYKIVILENNSKDEKTFEYYKLINKKKNIQILEFKGEEFNYSKLINFGIKNTSGDYILQLNNSLEIISPNWLENMLQYAQRKDIGIVGAKIYNCDNTVQHAGIAVGSNCIQIQMYKGHSKDEYFINILKNVSAVTGDCLLAKRSIYEEVNFITEELSVAYSDVDFCLKVREKGYLIVYIPYVELYNYESKFIKQNNTIEKQTNLNNDSKIFKKRWKNILKYGDPYYNINFSLNTSTPTISTEKINYN